MAKIAEYKTSRSNTVKGGIVVRIKTNVTGEWREVLGEGIDFLTALTNAWSKLGYTVDEANHALDS